MTPQVVYLLEKRQERQLSPESIGHHEPTSIIEEGVVHIASTLIKARAKAWELRHELSLEPPTWHAVYGQAVDSQDVLLEPNGNFFIELYGPHGLSLDEQPFDGYAPELASICRQERMLSDLWRAKKSAEAIPAFAELSHMSTALALAWYEYLPAKDKKRLGLKALAPLLEKASKEERLRLITLLPAASPSLKKR